MSRTNVRLAYTTFNLASAAACGVSAVVSVTLSSPHGDAPDGGRVTTVIANPTTNQPLDVEHRVVWTDVSGASQVSPLYIRELTSSVVAIGSGANMAIPVEGVVGSALHIAIMAGVTLTSTISGTVTVWRQ